MNLCKPLQGARTGHAGARKSRASFVHAAMMQVQSKQVQEQGKKDTRTKFKDTNE